VSRTLAALCTALGLTLSLGTAPATAAKKPPAPPGDALTRHALSTLDSWTAWLRANKASGYVGEVGWPRDDDRWSPVAHAWYAKAEASNLSVSTWVTGEWAGGFQLANFVRAAPDWIFHTSLSSDVMESEPGTFAAPHGVNVTGPEMGSPSIEPSSSFSNIAVGVLDQTYHYDSAETFAYLAAHGMQAVRLPFRWERIQRAPYGTLDAAELDRMKTEVRAANSAGLRVVLDMHNYGGYYVSDGTSGVRRAIGSPELPVSAFADVWTRLAAAFSAEPVWAFDLMNEPIGMPATMALPAAKLWEKSSQAALDAIRARGDRRLVMVAGYEWSGMKNWSQNHPVAWIKDAARNTTYEAHQYWNSDNSGVYLSYDEELALAQSAEAAGAASRASAAASIAKASTRSLRRIRTSRRIGWLRLPTRNR
jgi:hypothetical protein